VFNLAFAIAAALPAVTVRAPRADLTLEVARTAAQRERGLMDRKSVAPHTGMIFVFDGDGPIEFWMKDTRESLDMIFVASDGKVRRIYANVPVVAAGVGDDAIPREDGTAKYVIELAAGKAAKDGIVTGTKLDLSGVPSSQ